MNEPVESKPSGADANSPIHQDDEESARETINARASTGTTALMLAAGQGHAEIFNLLIQEPAEVNAIREDGRSALDLSADAGHVARA